MVSNVSGKGVFGHMMDAKRMAETTITESRMRPLLFWFDVCCKSLCPHVFRGLRYRGQLTNLSFLPSDPLILVSIEGRRAVKIPEGPGIVTPARPTIILNTPRLVVTVTVHFSTSHTGSQVHSNTQLYEYTPRSAHLKLCCPSSSPGHSCQHTSLPHCHLDTSRPHPDPLEGSSTR